MFFIFKIQNFFETIFCRVLKRVGGKWLNRSLKQIDGDKFICLDPLLKKDDCLVYSFGLNNDWTFEDRMDAIGLPLFLINGEPISGPKYTFRLSTSFRFDKLCSILILI